MANSEEAAKLRIVSHMNKDHHDSIVRYLEYYKKLSSWASESYRMTDCDVNGMTFQPSSASSTAKPSTHFVSFNPPLKSLRETRERVVEMDRECLRGLNRSDITIREYVPPYGWYWVEFGIIAATFAAYSQRWWFEARGPVADLLGEGFAKFSWTIQPWLITFMIVVHLTETAGLIQTRLRKHSVSPRSMVFWQWCLGHFIEGFFSFQRFDELVSRKKAEKEKQKH